MDLDDNNSIASTGDESHDSEAEWNVKRILAEGQVDGQKKYLVEWEGFHLCKASWEPKEHFNLPSLLRDWRKQKLKHEAGIAVKFNIDDWRIARVRELRDRYARHDERNRERLRRGQEATEYDFSLDEMISYINSIPTDKPGNIGLADVELNPTACAQPTLESSSSTTNSVNCVDVSLNKSHSREEETAAAVCRGYVAAEHEDGVSEMLCSDFAETAITSSSVSSSTPAMREISNDRNVCLSTIPLVMAVLDTQTTARKEDVLPQKKLDTDEERLESHAMDISDFDCAMTPPRYTANSPPKSLEAIELSAKQPRAPEANMNTGSSQPAVQDLGESTRPASFQTDDGNEKKRKRVSFNLAPPALERTLSNETSLFVGEDSPTQPVDLGLNSPSDKLNPEDQEKEQGRGHIPKDCQPKTCMIGLKKLTCSFHVSLRPGNSETEWYQTLMDKETFHFSYMCTAQDFIHHLRSGEMSSGYWVGGTACLHLESNDMEFMAYLKCSSIGLLCHDGRYCILLYPTECTDWQQTPLPTTQPPAGHALRYLAFTPNENFRLGDLSLDFSQKFASGIGVFDRRLYYELLPKIDCIDRSRQHCDSFFFIFPPCAKPEEDLLCRWLRTLNKDCEIRSSAVAGHWHTFLQGTRGTVILHQDCVDSIYRMKNLEQLLHARNEDYSFWTFRLPMCPPSYQSLTQPGIVFDRAFPPGIAVMATPSFWISQPLQAYSLLKWIWWNFTKQAKTLRGRLVVCSEMEDWLLSLALEKKEARGGFIESKDVAEARLKTYMLMNKLIYEVPAGVQSAIVCAPVYIDGNDEQSLVNWFGWWSISQMNQFRKFTVIGSENHDEARLSRQIERRALRGLFAASNNILKKNGSIKQSEFALVATDSADDLGRFLRQSNDNAKRVTGSGHRLDICPWPFEQPTAEFACDALARWAHTSPSRIQKQERKRSNDANTLAAFFYTAREVRSGTGQLQDRARDPWIAFLRPIELPRQPWTSSELLIWDYSLRDLTRGQECVYETDLSSAQRELIVNVVRHCESIRLPLSCVWVGSFKSSRQYTEPLDLTLDWLSAVTDNIESWLPLSHNDMLDRTWREIVPGTPKHRSRASVGSASPCTRGTDAILLQGKLRMVFEPPTGGAERGLQPCVNRLYKWAMASRVDKEDEYTYVPTIEWYKEQWDAGRGFEHIRMCSWKSFFKNHKIDDPERQE